MAVFRLSNYIIDTPSIGFIATYNAVSRRMKTLNHSLMSAGKEFQRPSVLRAAVGAATAQVVKSKRHTAIILCTAPPVAAGNWANPQARSAALLAEKFKASERPPATTQSPLVH